MLDGGVAGEPGVDVCPALPLEVVELPGDVPAAGELCAIAQLAQHNTTESKVNFFVDIESLRISGVVCYASDCLPYSTKSLLD